MTDEAAIAAGAGDALTDSPTEADVRAAQEAAEAAALAPGEEQASPVPVEGDEVEPGTEQARQDSPPVAGSMAEVEAARSGVAQEPPAGSEVVVVGDTRLDDLEARVARLEALADAAR